MKDSLMKERLKKFFKDVKIGTIQQSDFVVSMRVKDFDPATNDLWENDANKSYPRDLFCVNCKEQVVMSNGAFAEYSTDPNPAKILCGDCMLEAIHKKLKGKNA